jgi:hypothetical protein
MIKCHVNHRNINTFQKSPLLAKQISANKIKPGFKILHIDIYRQMMEDGHFSKMPYHVFSKIVNSFWKSVIRKMLSDDMYIFLAPYGLGALYLVERTKNRERKLINVDKDSPTGYTWRKYRFKAVHSFNRIFKTKWNKKAVLSRNSEVYRFYSLAGFTQSIKREVIKRANNKTIKEFETYRVRETPPIKPIKLWR